MINASIIITGVVIFSVFTVILNTKNNVQRASNTTVSSKTRSSKASDQSTTNSQARESIDDDTSSDNAASLSSSSTKNSDSSRETSEALKNSGPGNSSEADQSENSDSNDTYTNAYGHIVTKGQEDNSGMARRYREINSDSEKLDTLVNSPLGQNQKITQMVNWGFTFRPAENNWLIIYGHDGQKPIGFMDKDGNIQKQ
ncbi:hypothetical protein ACRYI5_10790 [Furfurilactobacillus sp. WILCCON 0119]